MDKPLPMWPVVLFGFILIILFAISNVDNPGIGSLVIFGVFLGCMVVYERNVKKFGKGYWKNK